MGGKENIKTSRLPGLLLPLRRSGRQPLQRQIAEGIRQLIEANKLPAGTILPATRNMAAILGVNRTTVIKAYQWLWSMGYIESRPGSYTRVRKRTQLVGSAADKNQSRFSWELAKIETRLGMEGQRATTIIETKSRKGFEEFINFTPHFYPPDDEAILEEFRKVLNRVMADKGRKLLARIDPLGYPPLRQYLIDRLSRYSIRVELNEVMITGGLVDSLETIVKTVIPPQSQVIVEKPTAAEIISLLKIHNLKPVYIPLTSKGMDLRKLEARELASGKGVVITMPNFQIPTGIVTDQSHRERLLEICRQRRWPLLESGFEEEMACFGPAVLPIKSMDSEQQVIHLGAFSRVLIFGHQLGWIAAPPQLISLMASVRLLTAPPVSPLVQAAVWEWAQSGRYDIHIRHMLVAFRKRLRLALKLLSQNLSREISWMEPDGGYSIWAKMIRPLKGISADELFRKYGVIVSPGHRFMSDPEAQQYFRLAICSVGEGEIIEGLKRIKRALQEDTS